MKSDKRLFYLTVTLIFLLHFSFFALGIYELYQKTSNPRLFVLVDITGIVSYALAIFFAKGLRDERNRLLANIIRPRLLSKQN